MLTDQTPVETLGGNNNLNGEFTLPANMQLDYAPNTK
jgi:hypothetical protein